LVVKGEHEIAKSMVENLPPVAPKANNSKISPNL